MEKSSATRYGFWAGLATVALMIIAYVLDRRLMLSPGVVWGSLLFYLFFMVRAVRDEAAAWTEQEQRLPFRQALQSAFQVYLVATVIYYAFYYLMFNVVDPSLADLQKTMVLGQLDQLEALFGADLVQEMKAALEADGLRVTPMRLLVNLGQSLIGGFIIALVVAGIVRSRYA